MTLHSSQVLEDDPVIKSNERGYISYATAGPNTRTTQIFINTGDNRALDRQGFAPFGVVLTDGIETVDAFYSDYGEGTPAGKGPSQARIEAEGNKYLEAEFPKLSYIEKAYIVYEKTYEKSSKDVEKTSDAGRAASARQAAATRGDAVEQTAFGFGDIIKDQLKPSSYLDDDNIGDNIRDRMIENTGKDVLGVDGASKHLDDDSLVDDIFQKTVDGVVDDLALADTIDRCHPPPPPAP